jgi:hypothetical protein
MEIQAVQPSVELTIDTNRVVRVADNSLVGCRGEITLPISIDNKTFLVNFLVLDTLLFHMILGFQYCKVNKIVIDVAERTIHFKDEFGYYQVPLDVQMDPNLCCLLEDVTIPAFSERLVDIQVPEVTNGAYLFTKESSLLPNEGLSVADGIMSFKNGIGVVAMANLSGKEVKVKAGLMVGNVSSFNEQDYIVDEASRENESVLASVNGISVSSSLEELLKELPDLNLSLDSLNNEQVSRVSSLLLCYKELFGKPGCGHGNAALVEHRIDVGEARPIHVAPYRAGFKERETIDKLTEDMLKDGVIRPSVSPWASPVVLVAKKDGQIRFCIDYRRLNAITVRDVYPLPRIDDCLSVLHGNLYFSSLALAFLGTLLGTFF